MSVHSVTALRSLNLGENKRTDVSALAAVRKWVFKAGRKGGIRVRGEMVIPVHFSMGTVK